MPTFFGSRGRIFHDSWQPDGAARGAVVLLHGYGEHLGLYDALARRFVADGLTVHAMDAVGHGRSDGERAVIPSWASSPTTPARSCTSSARSTAKCPWSSSGTPAARSRRSCSRCAHRTSSSARALRRAAARPRMD